MNKRYLIGAWLICGLGAIYYSYEYLLRISLSVMSQPIQAHFNLSAAGFGFLSAFYYYAYIPLQLPAGILLDRYGPRMLLTVACLICVIGTFMFAGSNLFWIAATGRFLVGFGSAFAFVGVLKLATIWLPEDKLAMVAGMASALGTVGAMLGDNLLGIMVAKIGWIETINYTAYFGVGLVFVLWFGIREKKEYEKKEIYSGTIHSFRKCMIDFLIIIRNKQMWINGLFGCLVYLPTTVFAELWGITYFTVAHGMTQEMAGFTNSLLFLGFAIGAPIMGYISDKMKRRKPPMIVGALGAALVMTVILYAPNLSITAIYALMFSLGILYSSQCIVFAVGRELSPSEAAGTAMSMTNMVVMLGAMILQPVVGRIIDLGLAANEKTGMKLPATAVTQLHTASDYQLALAIIPIGIFIAALLTLFLKETHADAAN